MSMQKFEAYRSRLRARWSDKFDDSSLSKKFAPYFGQRIEVKFPGETKRGYVSGTTGWCPSLMLLLRVNSSGSSWLLDDRCEITRVFKETR